MHTFLKNEKRHILNYSFITLCSVVAGQKERITEYLNSTPLSKPTAVEELWVNHLLPPEQKNKIKFTTSYRAKELDWKVFNPRIDAFRKTVARFNRRGRSGPYVLIVFTYSLGVGLIQDRRP
jgi:hypothetical protein